MISLVRVSIKKQVHGWNHVTSCCITESEGSMLEDSNLHEDADMSQGKLLLSPLGIDLPPPLRIGIPALNMGLPPPLNFGARHILPSLESNEHCAPACKTSIHDSVNCVYCRAQRGQ